jgi:hypothetical protein
LRLEGRVASLADPRSFQQVLDAGYARDWVVYAKAPFGGAEQVFRYLGRYSHRVAISNSRLREVTDTHVRFVWKDYADADRAKEMLLGVDEFIRRFLLHVLPKGFVRIRHYGLLASVNVTGKLEQCRRLLEADYQPKPARPTKTWIEQVLEWTGQEPLRCPECQAPLTRRELPRARAHARSGAVPKRSSAEQPALPLINSS